MKVRMPLLSEQAQGAFGSQKFVYSSWRGISYVKRYVKPNNPRTKKQRKYRMLFGNATRAYQALSAEEKQSFARKAQGLSLSGFNVFVSEYMRKRRRAVKKG